MVQSQTIAGQPLPGQAPGQPSGQTTQQLAAIRMQQEEQARLQAQAIQAQQAAQVQSTSKAMQKPIIVSEREHQLLLERGGQYKGLEPLEFDVYGRPNVSRDPATGQIYIIRHEGAPAGSSIAVQAQEALTGQRPKGLDVPGATEETLRRIGATPSGTPTIEAAKQAEALSAKERQISPAIAAILRSPTAQIASQETAQRGYEIVQRGVGRLAPEEVKATIPYENVYGTQTIGKPPASYTQADREAFFPTPPTAFTRAKAQLEEEARPKQAALITGMPLVKTTYEYTSKKPTVSEYNIFGFPIGKQIPLEEGKVYIKPALFGRVQETRERIETRKVSLGDITRLQIFSTGVVLATPSIGVFRTTSALMGAKVVFPTIQTPKINIPKLPRTFKEFVRSEEAKVNVGDVWKKIPTMRESAAARGEVLTRKIEFGSTFKEPTGKGIEILSGKQKLISIQEQKPVTIYESPSRSWGGVAGQRGMRAQASILEKLARREIRETNVQIPKPRITTPVIGSISLQKARTAVTPQQKQTKVEIPEIITKQKTEFKSVQVQKEVSLPITLFGQASTQKSKMASIQTPVLTPVILPSIQPILKPIPKETVRPRETAGERLPPREIIPKIPIFPPSFPSVDVWNISKKKKKAKTVTKETVVPYSTIEDIFYIAKKRK